MRQRGEIYLLIHLGEDVAVQSEWQRERKLIDNIETFNWILSKNGITIRRGVFGALNRCSIGRVWILNLKAFAFKTVNNWSEKVSIDLIK